MQIPHWSGDIVSYTSRSPTNVFVKVAISYSCTHTPDLGTPMYSKTQMKVIKPMSPVKSILIAYVEDHKNNASMLEK